MDPGYQTAMILERMGGEHWDALEYVEKYGLAPASEAIRDLEEWGLVQGEGDGSGIVTTTALGDLVLEERTEGDYCGAGPYSS